MIRLTWRQFRTQAAVATGLLVAVAVVLVSTRPHLAHLYGIYERAQAACVTNPNCRQVSINLSELDKLLELLGTLLVGVPALVGAFWGAPLIAREFENGTHRLVWTQSVSRTRWLAAKLIVVGAASVIATGLLSLLVTWWSCPDRQIADGPVRGRAVRRAQHRPARLRRVRVRARRDRSACWSGARCRRWRPRSPHSWRCGSRSPCGSGPAC